MYPALHPGPGIRPHAWLLILTVSMLTACAHFGGREAVPSVSQTPVEPAPAKALPPKPTAAKQEPLTQQLLFDILLGEIAGQRGRLDVSASSYLQAALISNDPRVSERAVQIATFAHRNQESILYRRSWLQ